jgi:O6-methylguanine-DNA--protein-cysteine methyltransferase
MHRDIYERLKEVARAGQTITYGEIAAMANLNMESPADRNESCKSHSSKLF